MVGGLTQTYTDLQAFFGSRGARIFQARNLERADQLFGRHPDIACLICFVSDDEFDPRILDWMKRHAVRPVVKQLILVNPSGQERTMLEAAGVTVDYTSPEILERILRQLDLR